MAEERISEHLHPGEIMAAASGQLSGSKEVMHWHSCTDCSLRVEEWRAACGDLSPIQISPTPKANSPCPSVEELASFTAGLAPPESSVGVHVIECGRCAAIVRHGSDERTEDPSIPFALKSTSVHWQTAMAAKLKSGSTATVTRSRRRVYQHLVSAAAVFMIVSSGLWWIVRYRSDPAQLLAQAYTAERPFDYRLPDAGYAPVRQQRGGNSSFDRPKSLVEAQSEIQRELSVNKENRAFLALKGRAQLLERDYEGAIESLVRATTGGPDDPQATSDLACAYAVRGDAERLKSDYGLALNLFLQVLKKNPRDRQTLFNVAIIYEKLSLFDQAANTWQKFLAEGSSAGWQDEAKEHIVEIEKRRNAKKAALRNILIDPVALRI